MLRDVQDTMLALDERLGTLETAQSHAGTQTRKLAIGVAQLADALTRRIQALEEATPAPVAPPPEPGPALFLAPPAKPVRRPPENRVAFTVGLTFILLLILGSLWFWRSEILDHMRPATPPPGAAAAPSAPVNAPAEEPKPAATTTHPASHPTAARHTENDTSIGVQQATVSTPSVEKPPPSFLLYSQNTSTASH